jgi:hypothetical protein
MSGDPNPFVDPGPFGFIYFDDVLVKTTLIEVDGCVKPEDWQVTKHVSGDGATAAWRGTKLAEKIKLKFRATDDASYAAQGDLYNQLRPKLGLKPPTVTVTNAIVNWGGIGKVCLHEPAFPKWVSDKHAWDFEWELIEYAPTKQTTTGPSDPAKPETSTDGRGKQSPAEKELADLIKEAKAS